MKGDEIVVRPNSRVFTVLGAVMKSGNVDITIDNMVKAAGLGLADHPVGLVGVADPAHPLFG